MHIPDGYLNPATCLSAYGVMAPVWAVAAKKMKASLQAKEVPLLASGAAFSFVLMMFNFPLPGGSSGHAVGGALLAILLGPWTAVSVLSVVLAIQALLFHDGGITTYAANAFSMAFVLPFTASFFYRLFTKTGASIKKQALTAAGSGYIGLTVSAFTTGVILGIQPHGPAGYAPYPLSVTIPVMVGSHLLVFSWIEGIVTGAVILWLRQNSDLAAAPARPLGAAWKTVTALILLSPLGLLANKTSFSEWSKTELQKILGYVPAGIARSVEFTAAPFSGYRISNHSLVYGYIASAVIGCLAAVAFSSILGRLLVRKEGSPAVSASSSKIIPAWLITLEKPVARRKYKRRLAPIRLEHFLAEVSQLEEFPKRDGCLQRLDPRLKTLVFILLAFLSVWISSVPLLLALISAAVLLAFFSKIPTVWFLKALVLATAIFSLTISAPALFTRFSPGVRAVMLLTLRTAASIGWTSLLALTTPWRRLIEALAVLKIPGAFLFILEMAFRYLFLFLRLAENMVLAKEARTFSALPLQSEQMWSAGLLANLFKRSLDLSENVYAAMVSRGYH